MTEVTERIDYGVLKTMVFMHALGVKWYMNESDKKCYTTVNMSLKFLSRYHKKHIMLSCHTTVAT